MSIDIMNAVTAVGQSTSIRPLTGEEYLESLRDGREIWLYGERVADVTTHAAFRNTARMIARLYDALRDPTPKEVLTTATDIGSGTCSGAGRRPSSRPRAWWGLHRRTSR